MDQNSKWDLNIGFSEIIKPKVELLDNILNKRKMETKIPYSLGLDFINDFGKVLHESINTAIQQNNSHINSDGTLGSLYYNKHGYENIQREMLENRIRERSKKHLSEYKLFWEVIVFTHILFALIGYFIK